jgi:type I restriction enzyme M protein
MTLHDAIEIVLREARRALKPSEIANAINSRRLYVKGDNSEVGGNQISARIAKHTDLFKVSEQGISLHDISIKPYRDFMLRLTDLLKKSLPADAIIINDYVASFLALTYYQGHETGISPNDIYSPKGFTISLFRTVENKNPKLLSLFDNTIHFISSVLSEFETEQILRLIANYRFTELPKPSLEEFSSFFNDTVNFFSWKNNFRGGELSTPKTLSNLMASLYQLPPKARVFDPFAGRASTLFELIRIHKDDIREVIAGDLVHSSVISGSLNLYNTGLNNFDYEKQDAFVGWKKKINADIFISNPPLGGKFNFDDHFDWQLQQTSDSSSNVVQLALFHLNEKGKAVLILPESFLFNSNKPAVGLRKHIVDDDILHGIILLPRGSFKPYTAANAVVLLLDKSKISKSTGIFIYDASDVAASELQNEIPDILGAFHSETSKRDKARWISKQEVEANGYDFSIKRYLLHDLKGTEFVKLKSLIDEYFIGSYVPSDNLNKEEGIPYIQVGDLSDGVGLETIIKANVKSFISDIELVNSSIRKLETGSVLIAKVGAKLKPTLFDETYSAIPSSNIIVLRPKLDLISTEYLISQLQSDYLQKQVDVIRRYNSIPTFNLKDLLEVKIKILPYDDQQRYVATYYSRKAAVIEKAEAKSKDDELYNLISRIKHEVKQPVSSIGIDVSILLDYLLQKQIDHSSVSLDDFAIEPLPGQPEKDLEATKVGNIINRIKASVGDAQETLTKAEETLNIGKGAVKIQSIEIKHFLETKILPLYVNANCVLELKGKEYVIQADEYQLKVLFKHLIDNALKYGFCNRQNKDQNLIRIDLSKDVQRSFIEIVVMNNGEPFSKGFNKKIFETKGLTNNRDNGSGFGGYHIKRIIENHKGEFYIADAEEVQFSEFKVKFKIYLPINLK